MSQSPQWMNVPGWAAVAVNVASLPTSSRRNPCRPMGINKPSLYAAFGNKEELFGKVLTRYLDGPGSYAADALHAPTTREVVERLIHGAVDLTTGESTPDGCLCVKTVHAGGPDARAARDHAVAVRKAGEAALRRRFEQATDLPPHHEPATLSALVHTISDGIAVQAAAGRSRDELRQVADVALRALLDNRG